MEELFTDSFLEAVKRMVLKTNMSVANGNMGIRKSKSKGSSVEFSDFREYSAGDDFRKIDWNAYGRFDRLFVKLFMEEREAHVRVFLDVSASMDFGMPSKTLISRRIAGAFAYMALANYDRVSFAAIHERAVVSIQDIRGIHAFSRLTGELKQLTYGGNSHLLDGIKANRIKAQPGISIIISDFLTQDSTDELIKYLKYHKQDVFICHIMSPQELAPDMEGELRLIDSETNEYIDLTASEALFKTYKKNLDGFLHHIQDTCNKWGAGYTLVSSEEDAFKAITRITAV